MMLSVARNEASLLRLRGETVSGETIASAHQAHNADRAQWSL